MAAPGYASILLLLVVVIAASFARQYDDEEGQKKKKPVPMVITEEVWFDVSVKDLDGPGEDYTGRVVIGLFGEIVPMCSLNFLSIAKGYKRPGGKGRQKKLLSYKNTPIHRIVPDFIIQMGDILSGDGTGGESIYGNTFADENFEISHQAAGYVSMANHGQDTNGSQFFILLNRARWLDGKHVVFGKVVRGMDVVRKIGDVPANQETAIPFRKITVVDCGVVGLDKKYELTSDQVMSPEDI